MKTLDKAFLSIRGQLSEMMKAGKFNEVARTADKITRWTQGVESMATEYSRTALQAKQLARPTQSNIGRTSLSAVRAHTAKTMEELILALLHQAGKLLSVGEILDLLKAEGRAPRGKNPENSVYTYLCRLGVKTFVHRVGIGPVRFELTAVGNKAARC